jgi:hypothetical protein
MSRPDEPNRFEEVTAVAVTDAPDEMRESTDDEPGSGGSERVITAIGGVVLIIGMFLSWYEVVRPNGFTENTTGWQTFTHLRYLILAGAVFALVSTLLQRARLISVARIAAGCVVAALVIRRIVSPPDLPGSTLTAQLGIYVALLGALGVAFGGLLDFGGVEDELEDGDEAEAPGQPVTALPEQTGEDLLEAEVVDAEARKERSDAAV